MKNSVLNFPYATTEVDSTEYRIRDIFQTNKNTKFSDELIKQNESFWYYKNIPDNSRLDLIAHKEYNDSSMWDILFIINQMDNIWDLPKTEDYITTLVERKMTDFDNLFGVQRMNETREFRKQQLYENLFEKNEKHRRFRFVSKRDIPALLTILKGL